MLGTFLQAFLSAVLSLEIQSKTQDSHFIFFYKNLWTLLVQILIHGNSFIFHVAYLFLAEDLLSISLSNYWHGGYNKHIYVYLLLMLISGPSLYIKSISLLLFAVFAVELLKGFKHTEWTFGSLSRE